MATKGCCGNDGCSCIIKGGTGIVVTGSGTVRDPYRVASSSAGLADTLTVRDSATVNLQLLGTGQVEDPMILQAEATVRVAQLADVSDPGGAVMGDVLMFIADANGGHWEFRPPPPTPAGAVNATDGIRGIGSVGNPLTIATSGEWGTAPLTGPDSTVGLLTYVDWNGELRVQQPTQAAVTWEAITGKPATFAPAAHSHTWTQITEKPSVFPVSMGGTGGTTKQTGREGLGVHVQASQPAGAAINDLWFW